MQQINIPPQYGEYTDRRVTVTLLDGNTVEHIHVQHTVMEQSFYYVYLPTSVCCYNKNQIISIIEEFE